MDKSKVDIPHKKEGYLDLSQATCIRRQTHVAPSDTTFWVTATWARLKGLISK
jgi:hypothetical protein